MKIIGTNKSVVITKEKAEYWITHQANQRGVIDRHVNALAKLLSRVGWRNDQRICITEDNRIINGLQRLSAIIKLGDFGWSIPVTVYNNEEMTKDILSSFNVQKSDSIANLMRRLYGWKDRRISEICNSLWKCAFSNNNATTCDLLSIYEAFKDHFDKVLSVCGKKQKGSPHLPEIVNVAAVMCSADGMDISLFLNAVNEYYNDNKSSAIWKSISDWNICWRKLTDSIGKPIQSEPGCLSFRIARRYCALKCFLSGIKIRKISSISDEELSLVANHIRETIKNNI